MEGQAGCLLVAPCELAGGLQERVYVYVERRVHVYVEGQAGCLLVAPCRLAGGLQASACVCVYVCGHAFVCLSEGVFAAVLECKWRLLLPCLLLPFTLWVCVCVCVEKEACAQKTHVQKIWNLVASPP